LTLLFIVSTFLLMQNIKAQTSPASATEILNAAYETAAKENKNVFLIFHASWCGWCHRMDNSMNDPVCKKFLNENFVICHLVVDESADKKNLENPGADELRNKYHGDKQGIPFWLIFVMNGNLLADSRVRTAEEGQEEGQNVGCPAAEKEVEYFIDVLRKNSDMNSSELKIIRERFRKNDL